MDFELCVPPNVVLAGGLLSNGCSISFSLLGPSWSIHSCFSLVIAQSIEREEKEIYCHCCNLFPLFKCFAECEKKDSSTWKLVIEEKRRRRIFLLIVRARESFLLLFALANKRQEIVEAGKKKKRKRRARLECC